MENIVAATAINKENILSISDWKREMAAKFEEKSLSDYYRALDFHALAIEMNTTIIEVQNKEITKELALRAKVLLKEFQARTKNSGALISQAISSLATTLEISMNRLMEIQ